ncbi:TonB-dependent receptor plug domain-containing protein [Salinimicrobium tongyeongense]|nr:TonB-dependent receptor [Salinimicrobium tongyeongense]
MMKKSILYLLFLSLFHWTPSFAQLDSINYLEEVFLSDVKLREFSTGQTLIKIDDSVTKLSRPALGEVLQFNSPIYFKQNGLGMVSSPSFRGTTASQTAVLWNGININSQFNGQTDFNIINTAGVDEVALRGGGGSVIYGTGAIGGTVHLNNRLKFNQGFKNEIFLQYGSYNSLDARYSLEASGEVWSLSVAGARNSSDNDYDYPEKGENLNGQFYNNSLDVGLAYKIAPKNYLRAFSSFSHADRHFSLIRPSETPTKYRDVNSRNLLEWETGVSKFKSTTKIAFLDESYRYYENLSSKRFSFGEAETFIARNDLEYFGFKNLQLASVLSNTHTAGEGSGIDDNSRNIFSAAFLLKHQPAQEFSYEAGLRKELTNNYESPLLFSAGAKYRFSSFYSLKLNASKNFRIPTYNDLYWNPGGNTSLRPETSLQAEIGNSFRWQNLGLDLTAYYIDIQDMIRWLPESGGNWRPHNEDEVRSYGLEALLGWEKKVGSGLLNLKGIYAYTASENQKTGKQLIYVPYHKATAAAGYTYGRWNFDYQFLFNGEVFTRSDNDPKYNLKAYTISNLSTSYAFGREGSYRLGARVRNLFDEAYQNVEDRWMPGVNFNIYLNLNF